MSGGQTYTSSNVVHLDKSSSTKNDEAEQQATEHQARIDELKKTVDEIERRLHLIREMDDAERRRAEIRARRESRERRAAIEAEELLRRPEDRMANQMNREEVQARLDASEARVASAVDAIRHDSDRTLQKLDTLAMSISHASEVSRLEFATLKSEVIQITEAAQYSMRDEVHKLRAWVLTGALTGALGLLGFVASTLLKPAPPQEQPNISEMRAAAGSAAPAKNASAPIGAEKVNPKPPR